MLKLLIGRAGTGKSGTLIRRLCTAARTPAAPLQILIVPEQFSHEAERRLCETGGPGVSLRAEVLSFTRLGNRVLAEAGGLALPALDPGGRILLMYSAVRTVSDSLSVYRRPSRKPAFLTGLLATLDECKSYCITPTALCEAGARLDDAEGEKLRDLGLIFGAYDALCARTAADPRDFLTRTAVGLRESGWAAGHDFYIDGFTDFTPQERLVLAELFSAAHSVTIALTCDDLTMGNDTDIFTPARRTAAILRRIAADVGAAVEVERLDDPSQGKEQSLVHLEEALFAPAPKPWAEEPAVLLYEANTPWSEVEWVAARIRDLARQEGFRWREIAVAARGIERYAQQLETVFRRYEIPLFLSRMSSILEKPILALVTAALDTAAGGYTREDLFRYLKTGLTNLTLDQCDVFENYVLTWDVKGNRFTQKRDWSMHPRGYGYPLLPADEETLRTLNAIRRAAVEPLMQLEAGGARTAEGHVRTLYRFLESIDLPTRLTERADGLRAQGALRQAEEYTQLWDILVDGLEQCALMLGDAPMELSEFAALFALLLSQYDVGTIPVSLDRVTATEATRVGYRHVKALFLIGAEEGALPAAPLSPGLLTDRNRLMLAELGLELSPRQEDKLTREMNIIYAVSTAPTHRLAVSWPSAGQDGEARRPSFLIHRLKMMFPHLRHGREREEPDARRLLAPGAALELAGQDAAVRAVLSELPDYGGHLARLQAAAEMTRGSLSRAAAEQLYGTKVSLSATRMDKFQSCRFSFFMKYGLRAAPRKRASLGTPEYGTFIHFVLEAVIPQWLNNRACDLEALVHRAIEDYIDRVLGGLEDKTARFCYLFSRLEKTVCAVVRNVTQELEAGRFTPLEFELGFGKGGGLPPIELTADNVTVSLTGFVDRVDGWERDGKLYLRVVDYKTGRKSFDLAELKAGLGLQMLLYLFALQTFGRERYGREIAQAGVLYLPAREAVVAGSRSMSEAALQAEVDKQLRRNGLMLGDPEVLAAMEQPSADGWRFLPLRVSKSTGAIDGDLLVTTEQLGQLGRHIDRTLQEIGRSIAAGSIAANPTWRGPKEHACRFCDYIAACQFEEGRGGDCRRPLAAIKQDEFWETLVQEEV